MAAKQIKVTVWGEFRHEKRNEQVRKLYPEGMHQVIAAGLQQAGFAARTATLDEPEHGLSEAVLADTDVLTWWGHIAHGDVQDAIVERVQQHVLHRGLGLVVLHSGHHSKLFRRLMGTSGNLKWREAAELSRVWVVNPAHPIAAGLGEYFELPQEEMYGEYFDIPTPDDLVFVSWFEGGDVFRSGCCWRRGKGRIFYFQPGHETYPIYHDRNVQRVLANACAWAAFNGPAIATNQCPHVAKPLSPIKAK